MEKQIIMLTESELVKMVKDVINEVGICRDWNIREVRYFHPSGRSLPNGSHYQRGNFLHECMVNKNAYMLDEGVHDEQYGLAKYRGGIITFSTDINALELSKNKIINFLKQKLETFKQRLGRHSKIHNIINKFNGNSEEFIGAYSVGNFFHGKYVGDNGEMFNEKSLCIEVNGLSSRSLLRLAEYLSDSFRQETVLVKDLNNNKIYLADAKPSTLDFDTAMERINTEC